MKKTFKWMLLVSSFVILVIMFSAISCSITPGVMYNVYVTNGNVGGIQIFVNGLPGTYFGNNASGMFSVEANSSLNVFSNVLGYNLLFYPTWSNSYIVNSNINLVVLWNMFDGWYASASVVMAP